MARVGSYRPVRVFTAFFLVLRLINCDCYYPNGDVSNDGDQPCSSEPDSACCPLNWQCLSNGLCYLENEKYFGRYTCTDKTWKSENCPNICTHNYTASGNEAVLQCSSGNYCCDANRPDAADAGGLGCCDTSNDFFALPQGNSISFIGNLVATTSTPKPTTHTSAPIGLEPTPTLSTTRHSSSDPSLTTTSTASSTIAAKNIGIAISPNVADTSVVLITSVVMNSAGSGSSIITSTIEVPQGTTVASNLTSTQTSSKNLGTKIGVGVGLPVGFLVLAALIFFLWRRHKHKKRAAPGVVDDAPPTDFNSNIFKNSAELDTPHTATTASPVISQRASGNYSSMGHGPVHNQYRGVSAAGLGMHPMAVELPDSPSRRSELSGNSPRQRDFRHSQMSELAGSSYQPRELPEQASG